MRELCPKCNRQGTVSTPPWVIGDILTYVDTGTGGYACPICGGAGYL